MNDMSLFMKCRSLSTESFFSFINREINLSYRVILSAVGILSHVTVADPDSSDFIFMNLIIKLQGNNNLDSLLKTQFLELTSHRW